MTILKLHKILSQAIADGYGRRLVVVHKTKCTHPLEGDGCDLIPITKAEIGTHDMLDEDGSMKELANGTIATRTAMVIEAEH